MQLSNLISMEEEQDLLLANPFSVPSPSPSSASEPLPSASLEKQHSETIAESIVLPLCPNCKVLAVTLYSLLSIVAFFGNALILWAIFRFRQLRTPTNMLIANLAIGDLMISIVCIPLSYWHVIIFEDQRWIFGAFLCKIFNLLQATAVFVSSWTLVAISFDRFMAIMFLMSPWLRLSKRKALYCILITWLFSLLMALPLFIANQLEVQPGGTVVCLERWTGFFAGDQFVEAYTLGLFLLQYCLPLAVLLITYTAIGVKMWNSQIPGEGASGGVHALHPSRNDDKRESVVTLGEARNSTIRAAPGASPGATPAMFDRKESVKKLIPMVLLVSALYAICWLPQNVLMNIWITYDKSILSHPLVLYFWWGAHTLAMFHSIVNPFIYYWQNRRIYVAVNYLLRCLRRHKASTMEPPVVTSTWAADTSHQHTHYRAMSMARRPHPTSTGSTGGGGGGGSLHHSNNHLSSTTQLMVGNRSGSGGTGHPSMNCNRSSCNSLMQSSDHQSLRNGGALIDNNF